MCFGLVVNRRTDFAGATLKPRRTRWCEWVRTWPLTSPAAVRSPYCSQMETSFLRFRWPSLVMPRCSQTSCSFSSIQSGVGSEAPGEAFRSSGFQKRSCPGNGGNCSGFCPSAAHKRVPEDLGVLHVAAAGRASLLVHQTPRNHLPYLILHRAPLVILGYGYRHQHGYRTLPEGADPAQHSTHTCHHRQANPASRRRVSCSRDHGQEYLWGRG